MRKLGLRGETEDMFGRPAEQDLVTNGTWGVRTEEESMVTVDLGRRNLVFGNATS